MAVSMLSRVEQARGFADYADTARVADLRRRVRSAMEAAPVYAGGSARIADEHMSEPLPVRKARALALKLSEMPTDIWVGQLFCGSMTLENPRTHYEPGKAFRGGSGSFPDYTTTAESQDAARLGLTIGSVFGHIVPDYPSLLRKGLNGILADAQAQRPLAQSEAECAFLDSVEIALRGVTDYAARLAEHTAQEAKTCRDEDRAGELAQMAANMRQVPSGRALTFWQALQSVWLLHMVFHATLNGNAVGRLDQYAWPYLEADLESGRITPERAGELVDCFCLKFNERAKTTDDQEPEAREEEPVLVGGTAHRVTPNMQQSTSTSSQRGTARDQIDATNHWLQNIVVGGLTPEGEDGTNPLSYLLLESYRRNEMTNPLLTVRLHHSSPEELVSYTCEVLKQGGGMPALFNDEQLIPSIERMGIPTADARDYTNDGCWETIIPGRTDFRFQRVSLMLCLEWALNRGVSRVTGEKHGVDTGDPRLFTSFDQVWDAFVLQLEHLAGGLMDSVAQNVNGRHNIAPVPLLSALIDGAIASRHDMTNGGARYRTFAMLAEGASHAIDSLAAINKVVFVNSDASMEQLCDALDTDFKGNPGLRAKLMAVPKYGNDNPYVDAMGRRVIDAFTEIVGRMGRQYETTIKFPCGVGTFSWYIGIGEGLGASPDGRLAFEPVSSNFSPALGRDRNGIPGAILSYSAMHEYNLPAGAPLDLRLNRSTVLGDEGTDRMAALVRSFVEMGGSMMTLTVVDAAELRAAQHEPDNYRSLRVRMGGWCAYFTMLSREQQDHHIHRQEAQG